MTKEEITEGNKLIAEFMGESSHTKVSGIPYTPAYDILWSILMPVVEKICRLKIGDDITTVEYAYTRTFGMLNKETGEIMVRLNGFPLFQASSLIESTWLAVIEFIKWHNQNLKN
jgi:hypothetical protein